MTSEATLDPLDWKFPPHPAEPAAGYASRLASLNGVDFVHLMRANGLSALAVHSGRVADVRGVAELGGLDKSQTETMARNSVSRATKHAEARFRGEVLPRGAVLSGFFRFCPHCIAQDLIEAPPDVPVAARPWLRFEWLIEQVRSCRTHSVFLAETRQGGRGEWLIDFSKTVEDEVLPNLGRLRDEAVPSDPNAFEDWLLRRLAGVRCPTNWLDAMPLNAAIFTCERLGVEGTPDARRHASKLSNAEWAAASLAGYRIASRGEAAIEMFLDGLIANSHAAGFVGTRNTYGYTLQFMERSMGDRGFKPLRDIVRRHAMDNIPLPAGSQVLGETLKERRLHTATSAAAASDTSYHTLRAIFARNGIAPPPGGPDHQRLTIRVDEFEAKLDEFATALTVFEMREAIGMPHKHILELIAKEVLPTVFNSRLTNKARHRIARADVDTFIARMFEGAVPVEKPTRSQVTIGRACLHASTNVTDLVGLVLDGKLAWKGRLHDSGRYLDLLLDVGEIMQVLRGDVQPRSGLTRDEIKKDMRGMLPKVVAALIQANQLALGWEYCPTARRKIKFITRESYDSFKSRYQTLTQLCHVRNLSPRAARPRLAQAGFTPAFDVKEFGNAIYEWSEALGDALDTIPLRGAIWAKHHRNAISRTEA